jgi:hypothetical protein
LNDDQPGEIIASSKSSMNASAFEVVRGRVPLPAQTPVVIPLLELLLLVLLVVVVLPLLLLLAMLPPPPPAPGVAVPDEHADPSARAHPAVRMDTCNVRIRFIVSPRCSQVSEK